MNFNVIGHLLAWYGLIFITGFIFWISFHKLFTKLTDRGYAISKVIALSIPIVIIWIAGFVFKLPINIYTCGFIILLFLAGCLAYKIKFKIPFPKVSFNHIIILEITFLILLLISLFITSFHPEIDNVTERIMDFKLLNVSTTTENLPIPDMWHSPDTVNYYYFGHFFFSVINKLTFTDPYMGYLLAMGFVYAIAGLIIFSLAHSIKKSYVMAILAVLFLLCFSNISFLFGERLDATSGELIRYGILNNFWFKLADGDKFKLVIFCIDSIILSAIMFSMFFIRRKNSILFLSLSIPIILAHLYFTKSFDIIPLFHHFMTDSSGMNRLWFPDVSRVVDSMINEFPFYSILIGDLHPHFLDLFFIPTIITLIYLDFRMLTPRTAFRFAKSIIYKNASEKFSIKVLSKSLFTNKFFLKFLALKLITLIVFSAGIATHSWELICFGILIGIKNLIFIFRSINFVYNKPNGSWKKLATIIMISVLFDGLFYVGALISQIPFLKSIQAPVKGIRLNFINTNTANGIDDNVDFIRYFKDNFDFLPVFSGKSSLAGWLSLLIIIVFFILLVIGVNYLVKRNREKQVPQYLVFTQIAAITVASTAFVTIMPVLISSVINSTNTMNWTIGFDTLLFIIFYLFTLNYAYFFAQRNKIPVSVFIVFLISFTAFSVLLMSFTETLIAYVQGNFDLSPFNQFLYVFAAYGVLSTIGIVMIYGKKFIKNVRISHVEYFILTLCITWFCLVIFTEFFYVAEFFSRQVYVHHRPNTVFKVNYINWVFFSIAAAWIVFKIIQVRLWQRTFSGTYINHIISVIVSFFRAFILIVCGLIMLYAPFGTYQWFKHLGNEVNIVILISPIWPALILLLIFGLFMYSLKNERLQRFTPYIRRVLATLTLILVPYSIYVLSLSIPILKNVNNQAVEYSAVDGANTYINLISTKWYETEFKFETKKLYVTLDGYAATKKKYPEVIEAVEYLKQVKTKNDVLLEANGDAYKYESIGSVNAVIPTVLGWWGHEAQWRETVDPSIIDTELRCRTEDISKIYYLQNAGTSSSCTIKAGVNPTGNPDEVTSYDWRQAIKKHNVTLIWVGDVERQKFGGDPVTTRFDNVTCMSKEFENSKVKIYRVKYECLSK